MKWQCKVCGKSLTFNELRLHPCDSYLRLQLALEALNNVAKSWSSFPTPAYRSPTFMQLLNMVSDVNLPTPETEALMEYADEIEETFIAQYIDDWFAKTFPNSYDSSQGIT
jgi:hypothetical protein